MIVSMYLREIIRKRFNRENHESNRRHYKMKFVGVKGHQDSNTRWYLITIKNDLSETEQSRDHLLSAVHQRK
jgi:hypothetical protein